MLLPTQSAGIPQPWHNPLPGTALPPLPLRTSDGRKVDVSALGPGRTIIYPAGGRVIFTMPPEPAPCGATALSRSSWRATAGGVLKVLQALDVHLVLPGPSPLGVPKADRLLAETLASYGVQVLRDARVTDLDVRRVKVTTPEGDHELDDLSYAHVFPHYQAPRWIADAIWPARRRPPG